LFFDLDWTLGRGRHDFFFSPGNASGAGVADKKLSTIPELFSTIHTFSYRTRISAPVATYG
jgi:hypothetical protein